MTDDAPDLRARFLAGMSHLAATVNVVTTDGPAGRAGVTVSAMSSVSADAPKPTLLVCVNSNASAAPFIVENGVFCVNVLRDDQSYISDAFAGRFREHLADKFDCAPWAPMVTGAPRVRDPLVAFDCRIVSTDMVGTHHVFFGEVEDVFIAERGSPLIYARRAYGQAAPIETPETIGAGRDRAANRFTLACFYTISAFNLPGLFRRLVDTAPDVEVELIEGDQSRIAGALLAGEADLGLMYAEGAQLSGLEAIRLAERVPYVLLPAEHSLAAQDTVSASDLADQPMVLLSTPPSPDYFLSVLRDQGVEPRVAWRSGVIETVRGLVAARLGYSILASRPASDISYAGAGLAARPLSGPVRPSHLVLVHRSGETLGRAAQQFRQVCGAEFGIDIG
ncbi:MAG: LysR substrate-binding domain-containing protein [Pseudomonadota bacterium]